MVRLYFLDVHATAADPDQQRKKNHELQSLVAQYPHLLNQDFLDSMSQMSALPMGSTMKPLMQATVRLIAGENTVRTAEELHDALRPLADSSSSSSEEGEALTVEQLARHVKHMIWLVQNSIRHNISVQQLMEDLATLGWREEERRVFVAKLWKKHYVAMSRSMIQDTLQVHPLKDMDWRFGVAASSSEMSQVGKTFLQMKISLLESADSQHMRDVFLELSLPQFYEFLHEMEKAQKSLEFFASA